MGHTDVFTEGEGATRFSAWLESARSGSTAASFLTIWALGFVVIARVLGLVGLYYMVARRHWALLFIIAALVLYTVLILMFNGLSRYRAPIEPFLGILAIYGVHLIRDRNRGRFLKFSASN